MNKTSIFRKRHLGSHPAMPLKIQEICFRVTLCIVLCGAQPWFTQFGNNQMSFATHGDQPISPTQGATFRERWSLSNISDALRVARPDDYTSFVTFGPALSPNPTTLIVMATKFIEKCFGPSLEYRLN